MLLPTIEPWEIMNIVNATWDKLFARRETNKKAIAERGWFPYSRNLITYPIICATMTNNEKEREGSETSIIVLPSHKKHDSNNQAIVPTFNADLAIVLYDPNKQVVNFRKGIAA